ncbi:phosphomannomutase, partial [bacterium]
IRGVVDKDLTPEGVRRLGLAIADTFKREGIKKAVVGRDNRHSSPVFFDAVSDGLRVGGIDVIDIGVVPTPVFYFAVKSWEIHGGVMITASHNPPEFNGFKVYRGEGTIYGDEIKELYRIVEGGDPDATGNGSLERKDVIAEYVEYVAANVDIGREVDFAIDGGNGTAGIVTGALFEKLGLSPRELYMEPDGSFPNHHPDPTVPANLKKLMETVVSQGLELGIGFDGDSDRIGVIDDKGNIIWGDRLLALFSRDVLSRNPGAKIIFEVKCSEALIEDIKRHGGVPIMWKTGHSLIKKKMRVEHALLAGEMSGHIFFADRYYGYDDAVYAACRLLEIVSHADKKLSELLSDLKGYESTPEIRLECSDEDKFKIVDEVKEYFKRDHEVIDVDGARVKFEGGWGLVRASNTQPVLVLRFEADTKERLNRIKSEMAKVLGKYIETSKLLKE